MMIITLTGPQASGKTLMREWIEQHIGTVETKTRHRIFIKEVLDQSLVPNDAVFPSLRVMRFKKSGKWMDTFNITVHQASQMQHVADLLCKAKTMPKGGSIVVVEPLTKKAEQFFYPIEVKDESSSN